MFDQFQKGDSEAREPRNVGAMILAGATTGLLVAAGLCGIGFKVNKYEVGYLGIAGLAVLLISLIGVLIGAIWLVIELILNRWRVK